MEDEDGATPLCEAASLDIVEYLIDKGAQNFSKCLVNETRPDFLHFFLNKEANVNAIDDCGQTPLHNATSHSKIQSVKILLSHGADVAAKDFDSKTPLHLARNFEIIQLLVDSRAPINEKDSLGHTTLVAMSALGRIDIIQYLIDHGADINAEDISGLNPLHFAGSVKVFKFLRDKGLKLKSVTEALHIAAAAAILEVMRILLRDHSGNVHKRNIKGNPIWISSITNGYKDRQAELLHRKKADINAIDSKGETPLHKICTQEFNNEQIIFIFVHLGANIEAKNNKGDTPLHTAALMGCDRLVQGILLRKANVNVRNYCGATPLHYAVLNSVGLPAVKVLLMNGADIDAVDENGETPLHYACKNGPYPAVELLLDLGADLNKMSSDLVTPLRLARRLKKNEVVDLLISRGVK